MQRAIVVGVDAYPVFPLLGCVNDATDIADCLVLEQYDFDVRLITDRAATRESVLAALGEAAYNTSGRFLLFYFAGHGQVLGDNSYLVLPDGTPYDPGIAIAHLGQLMEAASANYDHVLFILDACHSGSAITWVNSRPLQPLDIDRGMTSVNESRCILAACRPDEKSIEVDAHGIFTDALMEGLLGDAVDFAGEISVLGLYDFVAKAIPQTIQTPVFKGDVAGTVILGTGFEPRQGAPISPDEVGRTLGTAQSIVDKYYYLEQRALAERTFMKREGYKQCALELAPLIRWHEDTEKSLADIRRQSLWKQLTSQIRTFQGRLATLEVGVETQFGEVLSHLGHGGFGHVWQLRAGDQLRALKVFHGNELDDAVKAQRFRNGHTNMRKLDHPRIVSVHELTQTPLGFLMDYIPGDNLRDSYLDRSEASAILRVIIEIVETIQHAHGAGVKHRDIKPENIIIVFDETGRPVPYLTDFDLAYHETNRTVTTAGVGGVINYAAPEQFYMPNAAAARSETVDIYGLAQLMYFVITGEDPAPDASDRNAAHLRSVLNDWVEGRAAALLLDAYVKCTDREPSERIQTALELCQVLTRAENWVLSASGSSKVREDDFCTRFGHLRAGVSGYHATERTARFSSLSGSVEVNIRLKGSGSRKLDAVMIEMELSVTGTIPVPGFTSGHSVRQTLNNRIDKQLAKYRGVSRHAGTKGQFQTFIEVDDVDLSIDGLSHLSDVLSAVIDSIEQW